VYLAGVREALVEAALPVTLQQTATPPPGLRYTLRRPTENQAGSRPGNVRLQGESAMKQAIRLAGTVLCFSLFAMSMATAQVKYNEGPVERVVLIDILPGHFDAFIDDLKHNIVPIWQAEKEAGLIENYQMFLNQTGNGADDWDFGFSITYKNMAALDGLADKVYGIRMKQYGDRTAEQKVIDKRVENAKVVSSILTRDITLR
jgi:hypothetical protein